VVARWIVEHHRGELSLVTREGPGTTLEVRLPTYRGEGNGQ
jgi:signal transduction histidine kinase